MTCATTVWNAALLGLMSVLIIIANLIIIVIVCRNRAFQTENARLLVRSLAFSDLSNGILLVMTTCNAFYGKLVYNHLVCVLMSKFQGASWICTLYLVMLMNYDKYIAICRPLDYPRICAYKKCKLTMCCLLFGGICGACLSFVVPSWKVIYRAELYMCMVDWTSENVSSLAMAIGIGFCPSLCVIFFTNIRILQVVQKQGRATQPDRRQRALNRGVAVCLMIVLTMMLTWTPWSIVEIIRLHTYRLELDNNTTFFLYFLAMSNSIWNLLIYIFWNNAFRKSLMCSKIAKERTQVTCVSNAVAHSSVG